MLALGLLGFGIWVGWFGWLGIWSLVWLVWGFGVGVWGLRFMCVCEKRVKALKARPPSPKSLNLRLGSKSVEAKQLFFSLEVFGVICWSHYPFWCSFRVALFNYFGCLLVVILEQLVALDKCACTCSFLHFK